MRQYNDWREVISMPVVGRKGDWDLAGLELVLDRAITSCVSVCRQKNRGPVATTLSGGLDSSFCLAKIWGIVGPCTEIHTFTTGGSVDYPDVQFARKMVDELGTIHHELIPSENDIKAAEETLMLLWPEEKISPGDIAVFLTYQNIYRAGFKCVIAHDGIDELLGGYWMHRDCESEEKREEVFRYLWSLLEEKHLAPLEKKASYFGIEIVFPYLQKEIVEYISKIPVGERTSLGVSKIPLRGIAKEYVPDCVIKRKKKGFCSALDKE